MVDFRSPYLRVQRCKHLVCRANILQAPKASPPLHGAPACLLFSCAQHRATGRQQDQIALQKRCHHGSIIQLASYEQRISGQVKEADTAMVPVVLCSL